MAKKPQPAAPTAIRRGRGFATRLVGRWEFRPESNAYTHSGPSVITDLVFGFLRKMPAGTLALLEPHAK
jgi:hypothetical protein